MKSKIFVVQESVKHNFLAAKKFGDLEFVISADYPVFGAASAARHAHQVISALREFNPATDYLLLTGDPINIGYICATLASTFGFKKIRVLKWDNQNKDYHAVIMEIQ